MKKPILLLTMIVISTVGFSQTLGDHFVVKIVERTNGSIWDSVTAPPKDDDGPDITTTTIELPSYYSYDLFRTTINRLVRSYSDVNIVDPWSRDFINGTTIFKCGIHISGGDNFNSVALLIVYDPGEDIVIIRHTKIINN